MDNDVKGLNRRDFLKAVLGTGGALAASNFFLPKRLVGQNTGRFGGVLNAAQPSEPTTLDDHASTGTATRVPCSHIHESLLTPDENYGFVPQLAEEVSSSEDRLSYNFKLRKGVKFHNGKEMVAEDVRASIERFVEVAERAADLNPIEEIEVINDYEVKIKLSELMHLIPALATPVNRVSIMPKEIMEKGYGPQEIPVDEIIGTGPYKLTEWRRDEFVRLERFEDYVPDERYEGWSGLGGKRTAYFDEIRIWSVPEASARIAGMEAGDYDFAHAVPIRSYGRLRDNPRIAPAKLGPYTTPSHFFNCTNPPFDNLRMRQAVLACINNDNVMKAAAQGLEDFYRLDPDIFFREQVWFSDKGRQLGKYNQDDKEQAQRIMEEEGYAGEEIIYRTSPDLPFAYNSGLAMQEELREAGFNVKLESMDWTSVTSLWVVEEDYHLHTTGISTRFDPLDHHYIFLSESGLNNARTGYSSPEMDKLIRRDNRLIDFEDRYANWEEIQAQFYNDVPMLALGDIWRLDTINKDVKGYKGWYLPQFWDMWKEG